MEQVKRYSFVTDPFQNSDPNGNWIWYEDYEKLLEEYKKLQRELKKLQDNDM